MNKAVEIVMVIPKPGCKVRDPETKKYLESSGEPKEKTLYWIRRQAEGSVELKPIEKNTTTSKK